ncbi:MAG: hypothetical protein WCZ87_08840, partial [Thiohalobacteraceae bacterium]
MEARNQADHNKLLGVLGALAVPDICVTKKPYNPKPSKPVPNKNAITCEFVTGFRHSAPYIHA